MRSVRRTDGYVQTRFPDKLVVVRHVGFADRELVFADIDVPLMTTEGSASN